MRATLILNQRRVFRLRIPSYDRSAAILVGFWLLANLAYITFLCPFDLAPDEAHYWHWSRHLDWSYYSKGPLVAWLIRISCELFGNNPMAVRLPAALSSAALFAGLYVLLSNVLRDRRFALFALLILSTIPAVSAGAVLMTIDPPFLACWCWALVCVHCALHGGQLRWWIGAGICTAIGVLAKYPMLLLPLAVLGYLLSERLSEFRRAGVWAYLLLTLLGCVPIVLWNANHDWASFHHVVEQAGLRGESNASWLNPIRYLGGQAGVLLVFWFAAFIGGAWLAAPWRSSAKVLSLIWWSSVPVWLVFFSASFAAPGQANWPAAAYVGGMVLGAAWVRQQLYLPYRRHLVRAVAITAGIGVVLSLVARFPTGPRQLFARLLQNPSDTRPTPVRQFDPTSRLLGWRTLAAAIDDLPVQDPVLAGMTWTIPGELSFYCNGHPEAYSFGPALADRHSQYDLWRPNPVEDPEHFRGRTFIYVGDEIPKGEEVFGAIDPPIRVMHIEAGVPITVWTIWICRGFKGFPARPIRAGY